MKLIKNVNIIQADKIKYDSGIIFSRNINKIMEKKELENVENERNELEIVDGQGMYLSPGFIDLHIHGAAGYDTMDGSYEALNSISKALLATGVTSFLPTTMAMGEGDIIKGLENIKMTMRQSTDGARILGAHVEGPFLNPDYKGAQPVEYLREPELMLLENFYNIIKVVTIAPELNRAKEVIKVLSRKGIIVSAGHSGATYDEIIQARKWGLSHVTHLFNCMKGLHHRQPGIPGIVLSGDLSCELIADLIHIHPAVLKMVLKCKDKENIILITDQMRAGSLEDGEYSLGGQKVIVKDGAARLETGQLAGSILTLDQAVRNMLQVSELTLPEVISMVTSNPARRLGLDHKLGEIAPGYQADLVLLNQELQVEQVYIEGKKIY